MAAGALDELSGGRFCLGISSGAGDFLNWIGIHPEQPVTAVVETVETLRGLFAGEPVVPGSQLIRDWTKQAYMRFPTRRIPIYVGAMGPAMLRSIGRIADGGLPLLFPPEHFATALGYIRAGLVHAGRQEHAVDVAGRSWRSVSDAPPPAGDALPDHTAYC